jgi:hypothetical protein
MIARDRSQDGRPLTYACLLSAPHSGSTLIAFLLGTDPNVATVGEFQSAFSETYDCSCGAKVRDCPFWLEWAGHAREQGFPFEFGNLGIQIGPAGGDRVEDLFYYYFRWRSLDRLRDLAFPTGSRHRETAERRVDRSVRLARILCRMQDAEVFLDTSKHFYPVRFLARRTDVRLKILCLVRDGRAVMNSLVEKERMTEDEAVQTWLWSLRNSRRASSNYVPPADVYSFRLEDLCRDPEGMRDDMLRFLGVEPSSPAPSFDPSGMHVVGNLMRLKYDGVIRHEERWRSKVSPRQLDYFERRAGHVNRSLSYA